MEDTHLLEFRRQSYRELTPRGRFLSPELAMEDTVYLVDVTRAT